MSNKIVSYLIIIDQLFKNKFKIESMLSLWYIIYIFLYNFLKFISWFLHCVPIVLYIFYIFVCIHMVIHVQLHNSIIDSFIQQKMIYDESR